jgi:hypothetical protein
MTQHVSQSAAQPDDPRRPGRWTVLVATCLLAAGISAGAYQGSLTANLHGEYFNIAKALYAGRGFADPFGAPTGPTAWQGPLLPSLEAAVLWLCDGSPSAVVRMLAVLHASVLTLTGLLVIVVARQTSGFVGGIGAAIAFAATMVCNWRLLCFELPSDPWLNLLFLDLFVAGSLWQRPLERWPKAMGWGLLGGIGALANPTLGVVWAVLTVAVGVRKRAWRPCAVAVCVAGFTVTPWMVRNYLVFGRLVPVKSNLGYEFFQAQCLQSPGVLTVAWFGAHPGNGDSRERKEYQRLGEPDYIARKWEQFAESVWADPLDFFDRLASRFLCATLWYESSNPIRDARRPWLIWLNRCAHPLPFVALLVLLVAGIQGRLRAIEWIAIGIYVLYLLPYVAASYYDRYGMPLIGVNVLLVVWAIERLLGPWTKKGTRTV